MFIHEIVFCLIDFIDFCQIYCEFDPSYMFPTNDCTQDITV